MLVVLEDDRLLQQRELAVLEFDDLVRRRRGRLGLAFAFGLAGRCEDASEGRSEAEDALPLELPASEPIAHGAGDGARVRERVGAVREVARTLLRVVRGQRTR